MTDKKFKVVKIDHVYNGHNIVRMSAKSRRNLKVETGAPVKVKFGRIAEVAIVQKITRDLVGIRSVCTLSDTLTAKLGIEKDAIVAIDTKVSDKLYKEYETAVLAFQNQEVEADEDSTEDDDTTEG